MRVFLSAVIWVLVSASIAGAEPAIDAIYKDIHDDVCTAMAPRPCPRLEDPDDRWAFVAAWCERHSSHPGCDAVPNLDGGPAIVAFNHTSGQWRVVGGVDADDVDLDANKIPTVKIGSGETVVALVESTNPLLYSAEAGAITEADSPAIASLQALFDLLGPALQTFVAQAFGDLAGDETTPIDHAQNAIKPLECITEQWDDAARFITDVENRTSGQYSILSKRSDCGGITAATFPSALASLETAVQPLASADLCSAASTSLLELLDKEPANVKGIREAFDAISLNANCRNRLGALRDLIRAVVERLEAREEAIAAAKETTTTTDDDAAETARAAVRKQWDELSADNQPILRRRIAAAEKAAALVTAAAALAGEKKAEVKKALEEIEAFEERLLASVATDATKTPDSPIEQSEVADFFVVEGGTIEVAWDKVRTRTLTVTKSSPFSEKVSARRKDSVASSYSAESLRASQIDMSVALTFTQMTSPVYGAVSEPAPTAEDPDATKNVIAQVDEEERSGALALFVSYPLFARSVGLEIGVGTDTEHTALFTGLSWRIRGFSLGLGSTWQQVKALDGQSIGDTVATKDDIKLKNELGSSWYASFSFSLGSLNLFKKP